MKWSRQKFTFVVIPDANSQVVRFQLSAVTLLSALILAVVVTTVSVIAVMMYKERTGELKSLQLDLDAAVGRYDHMVSEKDRRIGDLETEVAGLSEQAKSIQNKMQDIHELESELKEIAGLGTKSESAGGEEIPVPAEALDSLVEQTHEQFIAMDGLIDELKPRLEETKEAVLKKQRQLLATPTIWPVNRSHRITSNFGIRRDPFTEQARFHAGLDFGGDTGDPVYATASGTVTEAGRDGAHGNSVIVSHGNGIKTRYSHLSKILTKAGSKVTKGQIIGEMGNTGRSTGPHLHYEVIVNGSHVDPEPYLKTSREEP